MPSASETLITGETGAQQLMGYVLDVGHPDQRARCRLEVTRDHLNRHGVLHGGISSCLLDSAAGATASLSVDATGRVPFLSVSLNINYVAPARPGPIEATGMITGGGRSLLFVAAELRDRDGTVLATSTGVYKRVPETRL
ncbi:PaaI family thioesterase [uncultured Roseobacter sp.]|uniref:PaaI family thioesterase n=1 Tax=uncultured Roseobacter sp. TaxID=114847 RepID=UPI0026197AA5|nr:PaaI family thioesterase [uncultured Roseobacter sp.]